MALIIKLLRDLRSFADEAANTSWERPGTKKKVQMEIP